VAAALKHQFVDRDGLLSRMVPFGSAATSKRGSP
jgi:cytochrome b561